MVTKTPTPLTAGTFFVASATLDDGDHFDVSFADVGSVGYEVRTITHGASCDVSIRVDADQDGTVDQAVTIDSLSGAGISQGNQIEIGDQNDMTLRITDTSGGAGNDYIVTGGQL